MDELGLDQLEQLPVSSKDGKALVPAMLRIFEKFQEVLVSSVSDLKKEFTEILNEQSTEIRELKSNVNFLQKRIVVLEERIEDNDAYERRDTLIVSGNKVPVKQSTEDTTAIACSVIQRNLNVIVDPNEISVSHRLPTKKTDRAPIIIKFCRRNIKSDVLMSARKKKPENLFINECLTPTQQTISWVLRQAKKDCPDIVSGSTTFDGKNYVWVKAPNPNAPGAKDTRLLISTRARLEEFCSRTLKKRLSDYVDQWKH